MDLDGIVAEMARILKAYAIQAVAGDRYSAGWVKQAFERHGIVCEQTDKDKSAYYLELEPLFAQGRIEILDHTELLKELKLLERRARAAGKTLVDHPSGGHEDCANALALSVGRALRALALGDDLGISVAGESVLVAAERDAVFSADPAPWGWHKC